MPYPSKAAKLRERFIRDDEQGLRAQHLHLKPVWIVLLLLIPCLLLTMYYARYGMTGGLQSDSLLPSASYAMVLFLVYLDVVGLVVLTLLLSRNLIKAYFERRHRLLGSGFRTKLIASFIGFSLIPTVLLAFVASGVISEVMKVWFNDQIEQVLKDSEEMARMYHEGHTTLATKSAHAISKEIFREDMLKPEHREVLMVAMARKRAEYNLTGIEVFSPKLETLARMVDPEAPASMLSLPVGQFVLQVLDTGKELTSIQEAPVGRLIRAAVPISSSQNSNSIEGVVVVGTYVSESLLAKMEGIARQYTDFRQIKAMENPIKAGAYLFVAVVTVLLLFSATWFGFYVARGITVPIQKLAEGTEAVARGDLSLRIAVKATDEIGTLVDSFNRMTTDLATGKAELEAANQSLVQSNIEADRRRAYTEAVVETIASGVLSIDVHAIITTFNHSAERILGVGADDVRDRPVFDVFKENQFNLFQEAYDRILVDGRNTLTLEGQMDVQGKLLTVGLNLSRMRNESGKDLGFVLVFETVQKISGRLNITMPEVYIYESPDPNAFATGPSRNKSMVAVSTGLLNNLHEGEIRAVLAHEMGHVYNGDMFTTTVLAGLMNTFVYLIANIIYRFLAERSVGLAFAAYFIIYFALSILASIPISWWSRRREFSADRFAANTVGKEHMISALQSIDRWVSQVQYQHHKEDALATMKFSGQTRSFMHVFSTHPPTEARVKALQSL